MHRFGRAVCVVGAGPRGLSVLERLCAGAEGPVVVHLVDPFAGRGGRVWSTSQPASLLMNTIACQVSMFTDVTVDCAGPIRPGPSLYDWAAAGLAPAVVAAEAAALTPDSYPTRAFYGHYLDWFLDHVRQAAPPSVEVRVHRLTAVALDDLPDGQCVTLSDGQVLTGLSAVVLAQGHVDMPLGAMESRLAGFADSRGLGYLPPGNPSEVDLSGIMPGEVIAVRGMGLAFFDYLALLTGDRGGRFKERADGSLAYVPSGQEPVIVTGSRRGLPYHARGENEKGAFGRHEPVFLTLDVIAELRSRAAVSFREDIWPLVAREVELVYYRTLLGDEFASRFIAGEPGLVESSGVQPWDWGLIAHPDGGRRFGSPAEFDAWLIELLRADVPGGNVTDPVKAALDVLRDMRNEIRLAVDHGGITGTSYRNDLDGWYTPLNAYLSIGPPARRVAELVALIEAEVVRVVGPGMRVDLADRGFLVSSPRVGGSGVLCTTLVEARLPEVDIRQTTDPLIASMLERGDCVPYHIPDPEGAVETGGLAVTPRPYRLLRADGTPHPTRFGYGVPTESVHWVTAAGIRPGVNSVILADADAIARAALAVTSSARPPVARPA
ncbi:FAD/NAD(P)-binding protein [Actinokineospora diospyrosa]|uniref:FAD-NAD(P)-binding n=1 Tax=Actinokineospora diospyrosa TaxID=103728 RepID=A0ABT1IFL9_9PSEU|nr:FAD/NAD(P)-binding protein [Actinokineospora diospyrosa]MCP2271369.1 FAD-NAD(P)-binding [Actinokineospora diospyrosa]